MITAVIFDMDGVIADSEYFNVKAKHLILKQAGIEVDWHYHDKFLGTTHEYMWTEMKKEFESLDKEVSYYIDQWVKTRKRVDQSGRTKADAGVVDLIRILKEKGFHLAVASSSLKEDIMTNMNTFGITDCFEAFISGSECENGKPDPEIFQKAAEAIGQKAEKLYRGRRFRSRSKGSQICQNEMHWICTRRSDQTRSPSGRYSGEGIFR